jgi:hypothetical protein
MFFWFFIFCAKEKGGKVSHSLSSLSLPHSLSHSHSLALSQVNTELNASLESASVLNKHRIEEYETEQRQYKMLGKYSEKVNVLVHLRCKVNKY